MKDGFLKVAAATPDVKVADCKWNIEQIIVQMRKAEAAGAKLLVLPELCMTAYTCGDLFLQETLLQGVLEGAEQVRQASEKTELVTIFGMPLWQQGALYNVAVVVQNGKVLGIVPKKQLPNYAEFQEARYFQPGREGIEQISFLGESVPFGIQMLFACRELPDFVFGVEICEDLWGAEQPSSVMAKAGATVIANLSASDEVIGKAAYRRALVCQQSARTLSAYIYADAGEGESTTDFVFSGHNMIAENGKLLAEAEQFVNGMLLTEIDLGRLQSERRRMNGFNADAKSCVTIFFSLDSLRVVPKLPETELTRQVEKSPFVPENETERAERCCKTVQLQAMGLKKRLVHTGCKNAVIGISGGLDSTLALLVTCKAFDMAGFDRSGILAVTMPCFGTTDRTYRNACTLVHELGATLKEVVIRDAVRQHFADIGQSEDKHDVTYENAQARERTQVLMDLANQNGGMVIGTGDLSELALGWATYNGDHMSMYGVNASVPKTLVRYLVAYFAKEADSEALRTVLMDILDTPVSPELLPPKEGEIAQKTEDIVGPYELHDFYLYYVLRYGYTPAKIYRLACYAFADEYEDTVIFKWLKTFYRRFFTQQFKRSCMPDGPKVGSVGVSPRGDLRMPSDACMTLWMQELERIEKNEF